MQSVADIGDHHPTEPNKDGRRKLLIFRDHLGMGSETFIYAQAAAMKNFVPHFVGSKVAGKLPIGTERLFTLRTAGLLGKVREAAFKFGKHAPAMDRHFRALEPALVHAHFGPDGAVIGPFALRHGIPLVVTFHGGDATLKPEFYHEASRTVRLYKRRKAWLQQRGALFIAVSDFIKSCLLKQGFPEEHVVRHYIGIDLSAFRFEPQTLRSSTVLFVARLTEKKGCEYLIDAMSAVQQSLPDVTLTVIGDGPLRGALEKRAAEKRVRAQFLGFQTPTVVREHMRSATVFSVPSITAESGDTEGFGMVFAEAAALGTPVASFASGGIPEVVAHGETGLLAPEKDVAVLATNLLTMLRNVELHRRFSHAGIDRVHRLFDIRKQTDTLETLYSRIAGQRA